MRSVAPRTPRRGAPRPAAWTRAIPFVILAGLAAVGLAAYFTLRSSGASPEVEETGKPKSKPPKTKPPEEVETKPAVSDVERRTYKNGKFGFSIVVPVGWKSQEWRAPGDYLFRIVNPEEKGVEIVVTREPPYRFKRSDRTTDWEGILGELRATTEKIEGRVNTSRQEEGKCSGYPAMLAVWAGERGILKTLIYIVCTNSEEFTVLCMSPPDRFDRLAKVLEETAKSFDVAPGR